MVETAVLTTGMRTDLINRLLDLQRTSAANERAAFLVAARTAQRHAGSLPRHRRLPMKPISPLHSSCGDYIAAHFSDPAAFHQRAVRRISTSARRSSRSCSAEIWARPSAICAGYAHDRARHLLLHSDKKVYEIALKPALRTPAIFPTASASAAA